MTDINVLVLSVGRRVELIRFLKKSLVDRKLSFMILGADASPLAPALYECDKKIILPKIAESQYLEVLKEKIIQFNIQLVIPTIDTELLILAKNKAFLEEHSDTKILVSSPMAVIIFQDKLKTHEFLKQNQILTPKLLDATQSDYFEFPIFIKPSKGSSSINALKVNDKTALEYWVKTINEPVIQNYINGKEYTVDTYISRENKIISESHRHRIKTRSGEILIGRVLFIEKIHEILIRVLSKVKLFGPITFQFIEEKDNYYLIEVNPRLGGGVPMSLNSGVDIIGNILDEHLKRPLKKMSSRDINRIYSRFDQMIEVKSHD